MMGEIAEHMIGQMMDGRRSCGSYRRRRKSNMRITKIQINKCAYGKLVGYANVTFEDCLVVTGIRIMSSDDGGLWISMPSKKNNSTEKWDDIVYPSNKDFRYELRDAIVQEYEGKVATTYKDDVKNVPTNPSQPVDSTPITDEELGDENINDDDDFDDDEEFPF